MKKLILPLLLLLGISMLLAVESAPSDVVGYFKKSIGESQVQAITLPFMYADLGVAATIGDQFTDNDVLQDIDSGASTAYYTGFGWFGGLETLAYGNGYYITRAPGNLATDYYLLGKVDPQIFTKMINGNAAVTSFGLNEAAPVTLDDTIFGANETEGDVIQEIDTGASTAYYAGFGWFGGMTDAVPTFAYYYTTAVGAPGFSWTYTPTRGHVTHQASSSKNSN